MSTNWPIVKLKEVLGLDLHRVGIDPATTYPMVGVYSFGRGLFHRQPVQGSNTSYNHFYRLEPDHVVMSQLFGWEGAIALSSNEFAGRFLSPQFPTFRCDAERLDRQFLGWYIRRPVFWKGLAARTRGMGDRRRTLGPDDLLECSTPLPPLPEQRRIVARIEQLAAQVHEARALRQRAAAEPEALIDRAASAMLDYDRWEFSRLGEVLLESPRNGLSPKPEVETGGRPMLRINAVSSSPTRFVDLSIYKTVGVSDDEAHPYVLQHEDVFIVRYNADLNRVAKAAIFKGETNAVFPDKLMRLRPNREMMTPDFLVYALGSRRVRDQIEELGKTTAGQIGVSGTDAKSFIVPVPPLPEQGCIVSYLDSLQIKIDVLKSLQAETAAELDALLPSILDKAFRGEL